MELKTIYDPNRQNAGKKAPIATFNEIVGAKFVRDSINENDFALSYGTHFGEMLLTKVKCDNGWYKFDGYKQEPINFLFTSNTKIIPTLDQAFYNGIIGYVAEVDVPGQIPVVRQTGGELLVEPRTYTWDAATYLLGGTIYALSCKAGYYDQSCCDSAVTILKSKGHDFSQAMSVLDLRDFNELFETMDFKAEVAYKLNKTFDNPDGTNLSEARLALIEIFTDFDLL